MFVSVSRVVTLAACMYIRLLLTHSFPQPEIGLALCIGMRSETLERIHVRIGINTPPRASQCDAWDRWCSAKSRKFLYRSSHLKEVSNATWEIHHDMYFWRLTRDRVDFSFSQSERLHRVSLEPCLCLMRPDETRTRRFHTRTLLEQRCRTCYGIATSLLSHRGPTM